MPFTTEEDDILQLNQYHNFDFGLQFEQLFFSILPSVLFIATCIWRTTSQARKPIVVHAPAFQVTKVVSTMLFCCSSKSRCANGLGQVAILSYVGLELSLLILAARGRIQVTDIFLASSALKLVSALFMAMLSVLDHSRSPRPSLLLNIYLFLTLLLDAAQARTLFLSSDGKSEFTYSAIFTAAVSVKAGVLLLEARHKSKWLHWDTKKHSPEETSGIFSLSVFFWLNKMFLAGYKKILMLDDLYPLDSSFNAKSLHDRFTAKMDYSKLKGDKFGLAKVLVRTLKVPLLLPIVPNLALVGFKFCQPLFLEKLLEYLSKPGALDENIGYGLIGASILIYGGIAISSALSR